MFIISNGYFYHVTYFCFFTDCTLNFKILVLARFLSFCLIGKTCVWKQLCGFLFKIFKFCSKVVNLSYNLFTMFFIYGYCASTPFIEALNYSFITYTLLFNFFVYELVLVICMLVNSKYSWDCICYKLIKIFLNWKMFFISNCCFLINENIATTRDRDSSTARTQCFARHGSVTPKPIKT